MPVQGSNNGRAGGAAIPLIDAVFRWCECLRGQTGAENAMKAIARGLGAEAIALSRVRHDSVWTSRHVGYDSLPGSSSAPRLARSFAAPLLGDFLPSARAGTVWLRSLVEINADPELEIFHARRRLGELAIVPLSSDGHVSDFLELHFPSRLCPDQHAVLSSLGVTLSEAWVKRAGGTFISNVQSTEPASGPAVDLDAPVLGHENPARLSRAEYRVCLLLSKGKSSKAVCSELSISQATLRTHLRNVYAKTNTENLVELVFLLMKGCSNQANQPFDKIA